MKYVRIHSLNSAFDNLTGEVVNWDATREVLWVKIYPMAQGIQFMLREVEEISEREYLVAQAAWALGVTL